MTKRHNNLFRVKQLLDEPLKEFLVIFVKEKVAIPRCDEETEVEAFRQGVLLHSDVYADLTKKACPTFATIQSIALEHVRLEENLNFRTNSPGGKQSYGHNNRKSSYQKGKNLRSISYSRPERSKVNVAQECKLRWPKKSDNPSKDPTRWCDFHQDIGHNTEECIQLRKQVAYLVKKGYLKDIIRQPGGKDEGTSKKDPGNIRGLPPPPHPIYEVKFVNGGSEICGLTSSAAKRIAKESKLQPPSRSKLLLAVTFDESDLQGVPDMHHDSLVITMQIGTAKVSRILIDGGSSINLTMDPQRQSHPIDISPIRKDSD
ncbi:uncharacterized protein LOC141658101 [Silene latifolia]|uniref:uncharacterized protein LOC141658101 n=1 Tax=Silene latifolia TaxID=37657 RepID=UPI003D77A57D